MASTIQRLLMGAAAVGAVTLLAPAAFAGCGAPAVQPANWDGGSIAGQLTPANLGVAGIVGLWSFVFTPTAGPGDWGYQQWHSDGTEIMNSGGHPPGGENFCLGTWRQSGPNTYHLKHFPLAYDPATQALVYKIVVTEDVTVDATGNNFTGHMFLQFYDPSGAHLQFTQTGPVTGHRILPN